MPNDFLPTMASGAAVIAPKLRLTHLTGSLTGRMVDLAPGTYRVGRHPDSAVRYDHTIDFLVSTRHGQLSVEDGLWVFADTNSTNGTYVGGARITRHTLGKGQTLILGTPGAPGSASFLVELDPADARAGMGTGSSEGGDGPFAQEPPESQVFVQFTCQHCGATNTASAHQAGQTVPCAACGKPNVVPGTAVAAKPMSAPPAVPQVPSPAVPAAGVSVGSPGDESGQGEGFFGDIVSGMKEKIHRMRERSELKREIAALEQQVPQMELDARKSCTVLGQDLWKHHAGQMTTFRSADALARADDAVHAVQERIAAIEAAYAEEKALQDGWLAEWQQKLSAAESESLAAEGSLAAAQQLQRETREAVTQALQPKVAGMTTMQKTLAELSAEASGDPADHFHERYAAAMRELSAQQAELSAEVPGWSDLIAARTTAAEGVAQAAARRQSAQAVVQQLKTDRAKFDATNEEARKKHDQSIAGLRAEIEQIKVPLAPYHMDLGRQFIDSPTAPAIDPPLPTIAAARSAVERWGLAHATLGLKRQRITELDA